MSNYDLVLWLAGCIGFSAGLVFWCFVVYVSLIWRGR